MRFSAAKTLALKYKLSLREVINRTGKDLSNLIKNEKALGVTDTRIAEWQESVKKGSSTETKLTPILYSTYSEIPQPKGIYYGRNWKPVYIKVLEDYCKTTKITKTLTTKIENEVISNIQESDNELSFLKVLNRGLERGLKLLNSKWILCNSKENIEIHHVKRVSELKGTKKVKKVNSLITKQIPLCKKCHLTVHKMNWKNKPINPKKFSKTI